MANYIVRRILLAAITMTAILFISYALLRIAPGDPTRSTILGSDASSTQLSSEGVSLGMNQALREKLHLDKSILHGFSLWLKQVVLHGDFGESAAVEPGRPVTDIIAERLPVTLKLNFFAVAVTYLLAIPLGMAAAARPGSWFDRSSAILLFMLYSLPVIWVGLVLQSLLCRGGLWPIFPVKGLTSPYIVGAPWYILWWESTQYYILPMICLAYAGFAGISRYTRSSMLEVTTQNYILTARAKGVPEFRVMSQHVFRNGVITLITLFSGLLPGLIAGSILVEQIFGIPGMGSLSIMSLSSRDYPLQMALFAFTGMLTLAGIFIADLLYVAADPRIKLGKQ